MDRTALWRHLHKKRMVKYIAYPLLAAYLLLMIVAAFLSDHLIFVGCHLPPSYQDGTDILKLTTADGVRISARYLPNPGARYTILYSHGNAKDLGKNAETLRQLHDCGFAVFSYDYHGYGTSQGTATEENAYRDIDAAYAYLTETLRIPPQRIIIYGRSLGGGPSVDLAARKPAAGLIIESTFTTAFRVYSRIPILPFDKFRSIDKIGRVHYPVLVMHGRADRTIPCNRGQQLYRAANEPKRFLWVNGAGHNNLSTVAGKHYPETLREFVTLIDAPGKPTGK